jgi:hypothetical protein
MEPKEEKVICDKPKYEKPRTDRISVPIVLSGCAQSNPDDCDFDNGPISG